MPFLRRIPQPPLSDFVDIIWYYEGQPVTHSRERLLPTGTIELILNLAEEQTRVYDQKLKCQKHGAVIFCGIHTEYFVIDTDSQEKVLGVHFKPGGAWPFLGVPARELKDLHLDADTLWGKIARDLRCDVLSAPTITTKLNVVERFLWNKLSLSVNRHPAVIYALQQMRRTDLRVKEITDAIGLSQRRFIELFSDQVGLTPKTYLRIMRFQTAIQKIASSNLEPDWSQLALDCGYFDQAHFIKDFRAFSGINPTTYQRKCSQHLNHVPLDEVSA